MAIYEYYCPQCRRVFEVMLPMSKADSPVFCPKCNSRGEKLLSVFASTADSSIKVPDKEPFRKTPKKK
jgi:putative FmdB family regulatory protein